MTLAEVSLKKKVAIRELMATLTDRPASEKAPEQQRLRDEAQAVRGVVGAIASTGTTGMANPKVSTSIRVGGGQITDKPTIAQALIELKNVIDLVRSGSPTSGLLERVFGLQRWVQQDREWRHTGFDKVSLEQLDLKLRELKAGLDRGIAEERAEIRTTVDDLERIHRVLTREGGISSVEGVDATRVTSTPVAQPAAPDQPASLAGPSKSTWKKPRPQLEPGWIFGEDAVIKSRIPRATLYGHIGELDEKDRGYASGLRIVREEALRKLLRGKGKVKE